MREINASIGQEVGREDGVARGGGRGELLGLLLWQSAGSNFVGVLRALIVCLGAGKAEEAPQRTRVFFLIRHGMPPCVYEKMMRRLI